MDAWNTKKLSFWGPISAYVSPGVLSYVRFRGVIWHHPEKNIWNSNLEFPNFGGGIFPWDFIPKYQIFFADVRRRRVMDLTKPLLSGQMSKCSLPKKKKQIKYDQIKHILTGGI